MCMDYVAGQGIGLAELLSRVKKSLSAAFPQRYWVRAEVRAVSGKPGGHCYLDLADKGADGVMNAQARGIIWASSWRILRPYFVRETGRELAAGMNVLIHVQVNFSELYSLSLVIDDIDPSFTVGELELVRQRTIARLREEGMMDMNSTLEIPALPRRFAVISSATAAGYGDFCRHLTENGYGFRFSLRLYGAPMQGTEAPSGIVDALDRILADVNGGGEVFDAVMILRGGGSVADLSCFDDYELCANIAQYPLPVMTAVGHDRDYHVCDMVAAVSVKTPTALADYLIELFVAQDEMLLSLASRLAVSLKGRMASENARMESFRLRVVSAVKSRLSVEGARMESFRLRTASAVKSRLSAEGVRVESLRQRALSAVRARFAMESSKVDLLEMRCSRNNPEQLMKSGYSLVRKGGKVLSSVSGVEAGDEMEVMLRDGVLKCSVKEVTPFHSGKDIAG